MNLVQSIMTNNPCYTGGVRRKRTLGLMLHSVGCPQPSAKVFINNWHKSTYKNACVHGFIDANDGTAYQTLPWDWRGWHGYHGNKGSANDDYIGVEMCEPACIKYTGGANFTCSDLNTARACATRTYNTAVELFAMLCKQFGLNPLADGAIISHKEGCARGIASNHGDPEHIWIQLGLPYTMDTFRQAVSKAMSGVAVSSATSITTTTPAVTNTSNSGVPFKVRVTAVVLNIRRGPGTNYGTNGAIRDQGIYTITELSNGPGANQWGKLKSGVGWVSMDYCKRI